MSHQLTVTHDDVANRRILRLALGVTLSLAFGQVANWQMAYITGILTLVILGLPVPAPKLKGGIVFVLALIVPLCLGTLILMPLLEFARWSGILLLVLSLFGCFYFSAKGGPMVIGLFMLMGLSMIITIGSVSLDALLIIISSLSLSAIFGMIFVWIANILLPDLPIEFPKKQKAEPPSLKQARYSAVRALMIMLPITIICLYSASSTAYIPIMLKVAAMAQQANSDVSRKLGFEQIESTLWGGLAAIVAWQIMSIWPSLLMYSLVIALTCLLFGARIFKGLGMHKKGDMWSYALLTMVILLTPALADTQSTDGASSAFYTRLVIFIFIGIYGWLSVMVFDAFFPFKQEKENKTSVTLS